MPRILAIKIAYEYREELGLELEPSDYYSRPDYSILEVDSIDDIYDFAREYDMSIYTFSELNPWINTVPNELPPREDGDMREIKVLD